MKKVCGAKLRGKDAHCQKAPMANGKCRLHGGATPSGPDSANYIHGRYADAFRGKLAEKFERASADRNPLDLMPELAVQRALLHQYVEFESGKRKMSASAVQNISSLTGDVVKTATIITKVRSDNALTIAEIKFFTNGIRLLMEKYVPDPDKRRLFVADLGALIPEQLATEADEPAELSAGTG